MSHSVEDLERFAKLYALGCIITLAYHGEYEPATIHHITDCGRRMGHDFTIPLSPWYHQGIPPANLRPSEAEKRLGPSLARSKCMFAERWGGEMFLLSITDQLIKSPRFRAV